VLTGYPAHVSKLANRQNHREVIIIYLPYCINSLIGALGIGSKQYILAPSTVSCKGFNV